MQTALGEFIRDTQQGREAQDIVRKCVHCGFCNATCPTYQLLGDELDGPRGRIYLIKQVLEGTVPTVKTQQHLDRCLTCRACETTCPSGVEFARLLDIGRAVVDQQVARSPRDRLVRKVLKAGLTGPLFAPLLRLAQGGRALLPAGLRDKLPRRQVAAAVPRGTHARRMLLLPGCVQPAMAPNINAATLRVFAAAGIQLEAHSAGCCGAIRHHLNDQQGGRDEARRNIDAWWPMLEGGCEALVINASGCGTMVREYGHLLGADPDYAQKAARISSLARDAAEFIPELLPRLRSQLVPAAPQRVVFHPPCSLQHGLRIRGAIEALLADCGAQVQPFAESQLCCGSAGTYSLLQPELASQLRERKLTALMQARPELILSANIGCIAHLAAKAQVPVQHWLEWVAERLPHQGTSSR